MLGMFELNFDFCYFADWASGGYGMCCETLLHNTEGLGAWQRYGPVGMYSVSAAVCVSFILRCVTVYISSRRLTLSLVHCFANCLNKLLASSSPFKLTGMD